MNSICASRCAPADASHNPVDEVPDLYVDRRFFRLVRRAGVFEAIVAGPLDRPASGRHQERWRCGPNRVAALMRTPLMKLCHIRYYDSRRGVGRCHRTMSHATLTHPGDTHITGRSAQFGHIESVGHEHETHRMPKTLSIPPQVKELWRSPDESIVQIRPIESIDATLIREFVGSLSMVLAAVGSRRTQAWRSERLPRRTVPLLLDSFGPYTGLRTTARFFFAEALGQAKRAESCSALQRGQTNSMR